MSEHHGHVFRVDFLEPSAVYNCYMPFYVNKGIFVPSSHVSGLDEHVFLAATLPGDPTVYFMSGRVSWVGAGRRKGFGVHLFSEESSKRFCIAVEALLLRQTNASAATYTM